MLMLSTSLVAADVDSLAGLIRHTYLRRARNTSLAQATMGRVSQMSPAVSAKRLKGVAGRAASKVGKEAINRIPLDKLLNKWFSTPEP